MTDTFITQVDADRLLAMEKRCESNDAILLPGRGQKIAIPMLSIDKREEFLLDMYRGNIALHKVMFQNRARQAVILARLDLIGAPHRNPDDEEIPTPHLHLYQEGFADKWAFAVPEEHFSSIGDEWKTFWDFTRFCNIIELPEVQRALPE